MMSDDDYRRMAEQGSGKFELKSFKFADVQVSFPTNDVAVIAYKVTESMDVDGKPLTLEAADATTWVRKDGEWLAASTPNHSSATPSAATEGRRRAADRKSAAVSRSRSERLAMAASESD